MKVKSLFTVFAAASFLIGNTLMTVPFHVCNTMNSVSLIPCAMCTTSAGDEDDDIPPCCANRNAPDTPVKLAAQPCCTTTSVSTSPGELTTARILVPAAGAVSLGANADAGVDPAGISGQWTTLRLHSPPDLRAPVASNTILRI